VVIWSGFPKSHNIGKSVDKIQGNEREVVGEKTGGAYSTGTKNKGIGEIDKLNGKERVSRGDDFGQITKGPSEWEGWGTALKPANEPICVARKPLSESTIAKNVLKWGTGGINIDGCRVDSNNNEHHRPTMNKMGNFNNGVDKTWEPTNAEGRFPANIILDEEAGRVLDEQSGNIKSTGSVRNKENEYDGTSYKGKNEVGKSSNPYAGEKGGASRFFYQAKVSKKERNMGLDGFEEKDITDGSIRSNEETARAFGANRKNKTNSHPTVKPVSLMAYLVRLVTPPNGIVLDPFMGSGSTGIATRLEGFRFCGMEMDEEYFKIASSRIDNFESYREFLKK